MAGADGLDAGAVARRATGRMVGRDEAGLHALTDPRCGSSRRITLLELYNTTYYTSLCRTARATECGYSEISPLRALPKKQPSMTAHCARRWKTPNAD